MDEKLEHRLGYFPVRGVLTLGNKTGESRMTFMGTVYR